MNCTVVGGQVQGVQTEDTACSPTNAERIQVYRPTTASAWDPPISLMKLVDRTWDSESNRP